MPLGPASTYVLARDASALSGWRAACELVGLRPHVSTWPAELFAVLLRTPAALVVVDASDGPELIAELCAEGPPGAAIIAITAADVPARLAALAAGARDTVALGAPIFELAARAAVWLRGAMARRHDGLPAALVIGGDARAWRSALAREGWGAVLVGEASLGLAAAALVPPAGVVIDARVPGGPPLVPLIARLREVTFGLDAPLVVLADEDAIAERAALEAGADAWVRATAGPSAAAERLAALGHGALGPLVALPPVPTRVLWCQGKDTGELGAAVLLGALAAEADVIVACSADEARGVLAALAVDLVLHADDAAALLRHPEDRDVPVTALGASAGASGPHGPHGDDRRDDDGLVRLPADPVLALARARALLRRRRRLVEARQAHAELRRRRIDNAEDLALRALAESRGQLVGELERSRARLEETALALREATLEAERLAQARSRFLSSVSHELRTPLNAILGFGRVLEGNAYGPLNERQRTYLGDIVQAGEHMLRMVDDLLDLQRLDEGRDRYAPRPTPLPPIVADAVRLVRAQAAEAGHELVTSLPASLPECEIDARACLQILINLLSNAVKFTPPLGHIEVSARALGDEVAIAVRDNGVGVPAEDQERIFEYFEQAAPTSPGAPGRSGTGSGIGLALVRALVRRLGGRVWLESAPGVGSTFIFTVPVARPEATPVARDDGSERHNDG